MGSGTGMAREPGPASRSRSVVDADAVRVSDLVPRFGFQAEAMDANARLVTLLEDMARDKGVTAAQLALAWVLAQGDFIVPIPGARRIGHLEQNVAAAGIALSAEEAARIGEALSPDKVTGKRYTEEALALTNG